MPEETIAPLPAPTVDAPVADAPDPGTADAGVDGSAPPTQKPEETPAYQEGLAKLGALLNEAKPRPSWQAEDDGTAPTAQRDTKPKADDKPDPLATLDPALYEAARREGGYSDDDIRDELTSNPQAAVQRYARWATVRQRLSTDAGRAGSEKQTATVKPAETTFDVSALTAEAAKQLADMGIEPEIAGKLGPWMGQFTSTIVKQAIAPVLTANEQRRRQEENGQFFATAQRVLGAVPEAKDLYGAGEAQASKQHIENQQNAAALAELLIEGARAKGNTAVTPELAFQFAHRVIAFDHVQATTRAGINRQIKDRRSNFALPSGSAKAGRDADRVVTTETGLKVPAAGLQKLADIQRGQF